MENKFKIREYCHVNTNQGDDRFVGIKLDIESVKVCFPIGYQLPEEEKEVKKDILRLIQVLSELCKNSEELIAKRMFSSKQKVKFPMNAYLNIIQYFVENKGYYSERNAVYKTRNCGNINWSKTINQQKLSIFYNKIPIYTNYTVKESTSNYNELITKINKYCVYESFSKLGWIFTTYMPEEPDIELDKKRFINAINEKLVNTNNDKEKMLFSSMIDIIEYVDENNEERRLYYGTNNFEFVWEKLIDKTFGIKNKQNYFPKTRWLLNYGTNRINHNLEPDTIMKSDGKVFVIDAKYYKYGVTGRAKDLPESASINKQITYGEFIYNKFDLDNECLFNAFLLPYNASNNLFGLSGTFECVGIAVGEWNSASLNYERVRAVLVDTRFLIVNYTSKINEYMAELARIVVNIQEVENS